MKNFETILDLDTSTRDYDNESCAMLLWNGTELFVLWASGCTCCGNMYDDIKTENATPVTDLLATAKELYTATTESDEPNVPALRAGLIKAIELTGYAMPLPELEA